MIDDYLGRWDYGDYGNGAWLGYCWSQSERARGFENSTSGITGGSDAMDGRDKDGVRDQLLINVL